MRTVAKACSHAEASSYASASAIGRNLNWKRIRLAYCLLGVAREASMHTIADNYDTMLATIEGRFWLHVAKKRFEVSWSNLPNHGSPYAKLRRDVARITRTQT